MSRAVAAAASSTACGMLAPFALGSLSVYVIADLGTSASAVGLAVSTFFFVSTGSYVVLGGVVDRFGPPTSNLVGGVLAGISLFGLSGAPTVAALIGWMALGGVANVLNQLSGNQVLSSGVPPSRRGRAYGWKQAAVPLAAALAGVSVPVLAVHLGWRVALAALGLLAFVSVMFSHFTTIANNHDAREEVVHSGAFAWWSVLGLGLAGVLANAAICAYVVFYVPSLMSKGYSAAFSGVLLSLGGLSAALGRIAIGAFRDRQRMDTVRLLSGMLTVSAVGFLILGIPKAALLLAVHHACLCFSGWGWNGLLTLAAVERCPAAPAQASGVVLAGVSLGGVIGPAGAGLLAEMHSYHIVWACCATAMLGAAGLVALGPVGVARS